jgi:hypothetical protein
MRSLKSLQIDKSRIQKAYGNGKTANKVYNLYSNSRNSSGSSDVTSKSNWLKKNPRRSLTRYVQGQDKQDISASPTPHDADADADADAVDGVTR